MKHSIVAKFIAIILCALFLLTAAGSGVGILVLTELELYEKTVDEVFSEALTDLSDVFAGQAATRYAGKTLGSCPEVILGGYGIFNEGYYAYKLYDPDGNLVEQVDFETETDPDTVSRYFKIPITGRQYMKLVSTAPVVESYPIDGITSYSITGVTNNIPYDGVEVHTVEIDVWGSRTPMCYTSQTPLGTLYNESDGRIRFCSSDTESFITGEGLVYGIAFYGKDGELLYKAVNDASGVGHLTSDADGYAYFGSYPDETLNATQPPEVQYYQDEYYVYDAVPPEGATVQEVYVNFLDGDSESCGSVGGLGLLYYTRSGEIRFNAFDPDYFLSDNGPVTHITFKDAQGNLLYEAGADDGSAVGVIYENDGGILCYEPIRMRSKETSNTTAPATEPEPTAVVTEMPDEVPTEAPTEAPVESSAAITDNMKQLGYHVAVVTLYDAQNNADSIKRDYHFGFLIDNQDGTITFRSLDPMEIPNHPNNITGIQFYDSNGQLLYMVQFPEGVGTFSQNAFGMLEFHTTVTPADVAAANAPATELPVAEIPPTEPPTEAPAEDPTEAVADKSNIIAEVTEPVITAYSDNTFYIDYWDSELQQNVQGRFIYEDLPEGYVMELWLLNGAYEMDPFYDLLQFVWQYRTDLFYALGISIFLFAVLAVYLCCAAGRKPGRNEVRADGLNQVPLDLYLGAAGLAIYFLVWICVEGGYYLFRNSPHMLVPYILIAGYLAALIIVGFAFACAAQTKMPDFYWLKNTLTYRFCRLLVRGGIWLEQFLSRKFFPFLGRSIKFCWKNGIRIVKALWKYGCVFAIAGFRGFEKALTWLGKRLGKLAKRTHAWLHAFLSLLPVTWQWLLVGFGMLLLMLITVKANNEEILVLFCGGICVGIILYASHCFGVLWASTKEMSKGNLETKVDDKLMVGCFKDFADDLNALADVAVIAAQKQLKSERMKTELITNVSHDIKTPLTSIINYVDLLQKPHTGEEQEVYLEVLSRQSLRMKKLLEDLIDMSKANTGNMAVYTTRLNAGETVSQALGEFADKLDAAQLIPVIRQPEQEVYMQADGRLAWRVLSNILSNVVKYALPGTRVYVDLAESDGKVQISVKNISREELNVNADELMERFVRGDASRNTEGSGLGLNIAQSLMEVQKGKLDILVDGDLFKVTLTFPGSEE